MPVVKDDCQYSHSYPSRFIFCSSIIIFPDLARLHLVITLANNHPHMDCLEGRTGCKCGSLIIINHMLALCWTLHGGIQSVFLYFHLKTQLRDGTQSNHYLFLLGRLPLEIDGRLLSTTLTSTWAVVLFSTPSQAQAHTLSEMRTHTHAHTCTNHAPGEICPPTSQSDALITSYP